MTGTTIPTTGPATATARPAKPAPRRSFLFTPADHARRVEKVFQSGADVAILDLEDAVAPEAKPAARAAAVAALARPRACAGFVRVNGYDTAWCYPDLVALAGAALDGIVVPKVESAEQVRSIDWLLVQLEREHGVPPGGIELMPIVETARGVLALESICAAAPRVRRVSFGGADYTLDLGLTWSEDESELAYARARLVHCSRVAGLEPPIDTVYVHIREHEKFRVAARRGRALGFQGKLCIHPDQVPIANEAFAPSAAEVERARAVIAAFAQAQAQGLASIQLDGHFIDAPIVDQARRVLAAAGG